jgi:hypothetical protein
MMSGGAEMVAAIARYMNAQRLGSVFGEDVMTELTKCIVTTYVTESGRVDLCSDCASAGDHGQGELLTFVAGERKALCCGAHHPEHPRRLRNFEPQQVCSRWFVNRGVANDTARILLGDEVSK